MPLTRITTQFISYPVSGSVANTSSWANNVNYTDVRNINSSSSFTGTASYAITSSYSTKSETLLSGANINAGQITASAISVTTLNVVTITSSIDYASGSNVFGTKSTDTQQFTGSVSITGSLTVNGSITGTSSYSTIAGTASYSALAQTASYIANAVSASYALTASYTSNVPATSSWSIQAQTASYVANAQTASYVTLAQTASYVANSVSASYALTASYASNVPATSSWSIQAQTASYVLNAISASYSGTASYALNGGGTSLVTGSTYNITSSWANNVISSSFALTASYSSNVPATSSWSTQAQTASYVVTAITASYILNAVSSSFTQTASYILWAGVDERTTDTFLGTASYVLTAQTASFVTLAQTASYSLNSLYSASLASRTTILESASSSFSTRVTNLVTDSGSFSTRTATLETASGSFSTRVTNLVSDSSSFSARLSSYTGSIFGTASYATKAETLVSGININAGLITASAISVTTLNVVTITSSIEYSSGSSVFGTKTTDTQKFTGSVSITGSLTVNGTVTATSSYSSLAATASYFAGVTNGTTNYVAKFTSANVIGTSSIFESGSSVGIGTTSPVTGLHVKGAYPTGFATIERTGVNGGGPGSVVTFKNDGKTAGDGVILNIAGLDSADNEQAYAQIRSKIISPTSTSEAGEMQFWTTTAGSITQKMVVDSTGNVGIGTTSPSFKTEIQQGSSGATSALRTTPQLVLKGFGGSSTYHSGIGFSMYEHTNGYWGSGILEVDDTNSYGAALAFYTSTGAASASPSERVRISSTGAIIVSSTIGTTSSRPAVGTSRIAGEIAGAYTSLGSDGGFLRLSAGGGTGAGTKSYIDLSGYSTDAALETQIQLGTAGVPRMTINVSGNTGIGTTSPSAKLHVFNSTAVSAQAVTSGTNLIIESATSSYLEFRNTSDNGTNQGILFVDNNLGGYVGFTNAATDQMFIGGYAAVNLQVGTSNSFGGKTTIAAITSAGAAITGAITATGNITAYFSDDRLKTKLGKIENALDKICSLEGFYYEANDLAQSLGYKAVREVGISAQSVQSVLPEIVAPAPIDSKYLTIHYERTVPLIIEAIKELRNEIAALKK